MAQTERAALGRVGKLGALYDIRTESFLTDTIFGSKVDAGVIDTVVLGNTIIELIKSDDIKDKFNKLKVEAELQVSVMAGLVNLSGSGSYLGEVRKSAMTQSMSLLYKMRSVHEEIMLRQNKDKIDKDVLTALNSDATHVVVGIDWGALCMVTCDYEREADEDTQQVQGELQAVLNLLKGKVGIKGGAKVEYDDKDKKKHEKFSLRCMSDVSVLDKELPVTFEGALELARSLPSLVKGTNGGKGVPLLYMLKPIDDVIKMYNFATQRQIVYKSIDDDIIINCAQVVEKITKKKLVLYDLKRVLHDNAEYVMNTSLARIDDIVDKFNIQESRFKTSLSKVVRAVRSVKAEVSEINAFVTESEVLMLNDQTTEFKRDVQKIWSVDDWKEKGFTYLGKSDDLPVYEGRPLSIFYMPSDENEVNAGYHTVLDTFAQGPKNNPNKFVIVDQDLSHDLWQRGGGKVALHQSFMGKTMVY